MTAVERLSNPSDVESVLDRAKNYSSAQIRDLRCIIGGTIGNDSGIVVGVNGSIARQEATSGSDVDLFFIALDDDVESAEIAQRDLYNTLNKKILNCPLPVVCSISRSPRPAS